MCFLRAFCSTWEEKQHMPPEAFDTNETPENYANFHEAYQSGVMPWDSGIAPPELVAVIEGSQALPPGYALDLGCGTGTNSLYLARHGWQVSGIDFVAAAIERAREKLAHESNLAGSATFWHSDVTRLETLPLEQAYTLVFDLGCLHSIPLDARPRYAQGVIRLAAPRALYMLYGFSPRAPEHGGPKGISRPEVQALFGAAFTLEHSEDSPGPFASTATWYWLRRTA